MKWFYRRNNWLYSSGLYIAASKEAIATFGAISETTQNRIAITLRYNHRKVSKINRFMIDCAVPFMMSFAWSGFVVNTTFDQIGWWATPLAIISGLPIVVPYNMFVAPWLKGWA